MHLNFPEVSDGDTSKAVQPGSLSQSAAQPFNVSIPSSFGQNSPCQFGPRHAPLSISSYPGPIQDENGLSFHYNLIDKVWET